MKTLKELARYPSAIAGLIIIAGLVVLAVYTVVTIPYSEAIRLWRGGGGIWDENPKNAQPLWVNWLRRDKLPETIVLNSRSQDPDNLVTKEVTPLTESMNDVVITFPFEYPYDGFPQDLTLYFSSRYDKKKPFVDLLLITPDGREIEISDFSVEPRQVFRFPQDEKLMRRTGGELPQTFLFRDPASDQPVAVKGHYELQVLGLTFEEESDLDARLVVYGQVHGLAGTDHRRRDLMISLMWGTPIALAFGLLAALGTTVFTMIIAATGVWFGGWVDDLIQRVTEVNMVLPFLPILIMIGTLYNRSIWLMLGISILLSIFGASIKSYRAIFMQIKESPYIEAARSYGAGGFRIVFMYLVPRIIPILIPALVSVIPTFVFLEASLAMLGLGDPVLPTWGKMIQDANSNGALYQGLYYWVLEPSFLLMLTGLAFAMVGFSLDRIFNPRLRGL
jgi:peptide/nickel transport system permease protein